MARVNTAAYKTFDQITDRLDEIIAAVRDKDTSLERSLDLFDEAIALGSAAVELVDTTDFTVEEEARLAELEADDTAPAAPLPGKPDTTTDSERAGVQDGEPADDSVRASDG